MDIAKGPALATYLGELKDPRLDRQKRHSMHDILVLTICAAICGADNWVAIERFGRAKARWFRGFLKLENGIPSHDTLGRFFSLLDPDAFRDVFIRWASALGEVAEGEVIAVDGKTLRRSFDTASEKAAIHMVNAWATEAGIAVGQVACDDKSNEITAIPKLLELLAIQGCIVTIDAMGCQKAIAETIVDKGADYVLALKGNQGTLHRDVTTFFDWAKDEAGCDRPHLWTHQTTDGDHGRIDVRTYWTCDQLEWLGQKDDWKQLQTVAMVESQRTCAGKTTVERRYYLSSLPQSRSDDIAKAIRAHWRIENSLHWVLDVAFNEDQNRTRSGDAAQNLGVVRQMALNLLKQEKTAKTGIANKRLIAGWDETYIAKVLQI